MLSSGVHAGNPTASLIQGIHQYGALDRMLYADCRLWLPENLLERGDRMTMAASVEGRVPFLDHELVEFAFRMPDDLKLKGFDRKWMVKSIARKYLPERIFGRRKNGFEVPLAEWFRGKLRDMCYDRICQRNGLAGEILSRCELQHVLDEHCMRKKDNFLKIWTLLGLAIWYDLFCLGSKHESRISTIGV
jgi:asparagine synthase (glutamine-hydrolysing)